jgi:hypothetical protein
MGHESRSTARMPIPPQVTGEVTVFQPMAILDLSVAGAQIETRTPLRHDSLHDFRLTLEERSVIVKGRVVYCQVGELRDGVVLYRCGVEFIEPSSQALAELHQFVTAYSATR